MKKILLSVFFIISSIVSLPIHAQKVGYEEAEIIAQDFFKSAISQQPNLRIAQTVEVDSFKTYYIYGSGLRTSEKIPAFYIINKKDKPGFVIVAADKRVRKIIAYSSKANFGEPNPGLSIFLNQYVNEVDYIISNDLLGDQVSTDAINYTQGTWLLGNIEWDQYPDPYNTLCPPNTYSGCVATAMAQIIYYYKYPRNGNGSHSYTWNNQTLTADFGNTQYRYELMDDQPISGQKNNEIATLLYHCGVSVEMSYSQDGSSAHSTDVDDALENYFNYSSNCDYKDKSSRTWDNWYDLIKTEIDEGRPVYYRAGDNEYGGHAFILDGYKSDNTFHINWGWKGSQNDFYPLTLLDPGKYNFESDHKMYTGIEPENPDQVAPQITNAIHSKGNLYANVTLFFSEPIDESTLNKNSIIFQGSKTGKQSFGIKYFPEYLSCALFPAKPFEFGEDVLVIVTSDVTDLNGNGLDGDGDGSTGPNYTYNFNTGSIYKDYSLESITLSKDYPHVDDVIDITATIKNTGLEAPGVYAKLSLYDNDVLIKEYLNIPIIQPNGEKAHSFSWKCTKGLHKLEVEVELEGDQNPDNNFKARNVFIGTESELIIDGEQNPNKMVSLYPGNRFDFNLKLQNTGTALMFADVSKEGNQADWLYLSGGSYKTVSAGDTETYNCSFSIPIGTSVGEYNAVLKFTFDNGQKSAAVNFTIKVIEYGDGPYTISLESNSVQIDGNQESTEILTHKVSNANTYLLDNDPDATFPIYVVNEIDITQDMYNRLNEATWSIDYLTEIEGNGKIWVSSSERTKSKSYSSSGNPYDIDILEWFDSGLNKLNISLGSYVHNKGDVKWYVNNSTQNLHFSKSAWGKDYSVSGRDINKWDDGFDHARIYFDVENVDKEGDIILFNNGEKIRSNKITSSSEGKNRYFNLSTSSLSSSGLEASNYFSIKGDPDDDTKVSISNITLEVKYFDGDPNLLCTKSIEREEINVNETTTVNLSFENTGSNIADNPRYNDSPLPEGVVLSSGNISDRVIDLNPEEKTTESYTIKGTKAGTYIFGNTTVTYEDKGDHEYTSEFNAVILKVFQGDLVVDANLDATSCYKGDVISVLASLKESTSGNIIDDAIVTCEILNSTLAYDSTLYMFYDIDSELFQVEIPQGLKVGEYIVVVKATKEYYRTGDLMSPLTFNVLPEPFLVVEPLSKDVLSDDTFTSISVSSNVDWQISESVDWINNVEKVDNTSFNVHFNVNDEFVYRNGIIVVSSDHTPSIEVVLSQQGKEIPPIVILEIEPIELIEDFTTYLLPQKLSETFRDDDILTYSISYDHEILNAQILGDEIQITSIQDANGNSEISITASDGELEVSESFMVNILPVNDPPEISAQEFSINENSLVGSLVGTIVASDVDGDNLTYSIKSGNINSTFSIDPSTGELKIKDSTELDYEKQKFIELVIEVNDDEEGNLKDEADVIVHIIDQNFAPETAVHLFPEDGTTLNANELIFTWTCEDQDGDDLNYTFLLQYPDGNWEEMASGLPETTYTITEELSSGEYTWRIDATDREFTVSSVPSVFKRNASPDKPIHLKPENGINIIGSPIVFTWSCHDPDGDNLNYELFLQSSDGTWEEVADGLSGTTYSLTDKLSPGEYKWRIDATDEEFTVESNPTTFMLNAPPVFSDGISPKEHENVARTPLETIEFTWDCADPDSDPLIYTFLLWDENDDIVKSVAGLSTQTYTLEETLVKGAYSWQIKASDTYHEIEGEEWHFNFELVTDIGNEAFNNVLNLYPNPGKNYFKLDFGDANNDTRITVYTTSGVRVIQKRFEKVDGEITIDTKSLHDGVYLVSILVGEKNEMRKLVIQ